MVHPSTHPGLHPAPLEFQPLSIRGVIVPDPPFGGGTYEVRLQLSRPMTVFEVQALRPIARGMHPVRDVLTVHDTTLERVAQQALHLASLVRQAEQEGWRLERAAKQRAARRAAERDRESARLAALARSIRFE